MKVLCLLETKILSIEFGKLKWKLNYDSALGVSSKGRTGRFGVLWQKKG